MVPNAEICRRVVLNYNFCEIGENIQSENASV